MSNMNWNRVAALDAACASRDVAEVDTAIDAHPNGHRGVERIQHDAVGSGQQLGKDAARYERLDDDAAGDAYAFRERVPQHDGE